MEIACAWHKVLSACACVCVYKGACINLKHHIPIELIIKRKHGGDVATTIAVVWRGPNGHQRALVEHVLVTLLHQLMRAADQIQVVDAGELDNEQEE